jgi:LAO/AO transport system kinase
MSLLASNDFWKPEVHTCSALEREGIEECWLMMERFRQEAQDCDAYNRTRAEQNLQWMWQLTDEMLRQQLTDHPGVGKMLPAVREQVGRGELTPVTAATQIIAQLRGD